MHEQLMLLDVLEIQLRMPVYLPWLTSPVANPTCMVGVP